MPNKVSVELAGQKYIIEELPSRQNQAWRKIVEEHFSDLVNVLTNAPQMEIDSKEGMIQIGGLVKVLTAKVIGAVDIMRDLLFDYSPALQADREHLEENGFDSEFVQVFMEVLKLGFPFGSMMDLAGAAIAKAGQQTKKTS